MRVTIQQRTLRFRIPLQTSYGAVAEREIYELEIEGSDGIGIRQLLLEWVARQGLAI